MGAGDGAVQETSTELRPVCTAIKLVTLAPPTYVGKYEIMIILHFTFYSEAVISAVCHGSVGDRVLVDSREIPSHN